KGYLKYIVNLIMLMMQNIYFKILISTEEN
ncbi:MAG: hypothetical protein RIR48_1498, partial [Bacteroidota bacterium]